MDKLGVVTDDERTKTAGTDKACPKCGGPLKEDANVPTCDNCGTEPFESQQGDSSGE